jgi:hypothetical protein
MDPVVWSFLIVVIICSLVVVAVLKVLSGVVADRKTRRIIEEGMEDNEGGDTEAEKNKD